MSKYDSEQKKKYDQKMEKYKSQQITKELEEKSKQISEQQQNLENQKKQISEDFKIKKSKLDSQAKSQAKRQVEQDAREEQLKKQSLQNDQSQQSLMTLISQFLETIGDDQKEEFSVELLFGGMNYILTEAMSKEKIKAASFKELINVWIQLHSSIMKYMPRESVTEKGDAEAKAQLMRAITDAVKSDEMDKVTMEGVYYQPFPVCTEITDKENLHAFAEVKHEVNVKT